ALDQIFVALWIARELRRFAALAAAVLMTEAAQRRKHLLSVDVPRGCFRRGRRSPAGRVRSRRSLLRGRSDRQSPERGADQRGRHTIPHHCASVLPAYCGSENTTSAPASFGMLW